MHSSRSSELTVYKVSHGYLQHHHHHWRRHHRRQHNQHDVHQLFQSKLILRNPTTSLSPRHALPFFSGLPREDFRWVQLNAKMIWQLSLHFLFPFVLCLYLLLNDSSRIVSTGATLLLVAFYYRLPWAQGCYHASKMMLSGRFWQLFVDILWHVNHSFRLSRASSDWFLSSQIRQCCLRSTNVTVFMLIMQM